MIAKRVGSGGGAITYWLHTDRLGSIQAVTNSTGAAVYRRTYRPYGETLGTSGSHTESRGWIDQRNDGESGLTYLHARYFDPKLGQFLSPDPIGVRGGLNLYGYSLGDPVNGSDRSGLLIDGEPTTTMVCDTVTPTVTVDDDRGNTNTSTGTPDTRCITLLGFGNAHVGWMEDWRSQREERRQERERRNKDPEVCKPGDPNCDKAARKPGDPSQEPPTCQPGDPACSSPPGSPRRPANWWADFFSAIPGAVVAEFGEGGCGTVFLDATRNALLPFSWSAASAGEPLALAWSAHQYNATLQYAAGRTNYLGTRGLIYPMKSSVVRAGLQSARVTAASGPLVQLNLAIGQGLAVEMYALANGQCR